MEGIQSPLQRRAGHFINLQRESFLNTLTVNTRYAAAYFSNLFQLQPQVTYLYDWRGAWLLRPSLNFIRGPFRFRVEYDWLGGRFTANTGGSNIGLFKDKDNLMFRIDYLL
jgi:hypothetical protein